MQENGKFAELVVEIEVEVNSRRESNARLGGEREDSRSCPTWRDQLFLYSIHAAWDVRVGTWKWQQGAVWHWV